MNRALFSGSVSSGNGKRGELFLFDKFLPFRRFWLQHFLFRAGVRHVKPTFRFTGNNLCLSINAILMETSAMLLESEKSYCSLGLGCEVIVSFSF